MKVLLYIMLMVLCILPVSLPVFANEVQKSSKPILIVTTDIGGGDVDDQQSLIRLLVYANEFDLKGIIPGSSMIDEGTTGEAVVYECLDAYEKVYPNLIKHDPSFPTRAYLDSIVKVGNPRYGTNFVGDGHDTDGSRQIIEVVDKVLAENDPRYVNISVWGGTTDIAQALWVVSNTRPADEAEKFFAKLRLNVIADQDNTALWILKNYPQVFYIKDKNESNGQNSVFRGMYIDGDESLTSRSWVNTYVKQNHGPLGALYPTSAWTGVNPNSCLKEGDTPSWFYFLDNGLHVPEHPEYGGWGGRFKDNGAYYQDAEDTYGGKTNSRVTVARWRGDYQNDFAARMDWCVKDFKEANHAPIAKLNHADRLTVQSGSAVKLDASLSTDPDGDELTYQWWQYKEAGTYSGTVTILDAKSAEAYFQAPMVTEPRDIHLILEVCDNGSPVLKSYRRVIVTVQPEISSVNGFDVTLKSDLNFAAGQTKTVTYTVGNCSGKKEEVLLSVAQYDQEERLINVKTCKKAIDINGTADISVDMLPAAEARMIKSFIFKADTMAPLAKCYTVQMYNERVPANGLVGYWQLNEGAGTTVTDHSAYKKTSPITGAVWKPEGYEGGSLYFGGNAYILVGNDPQYQMTGAMSLSAWVYVSELSSGRIVSKQGALGNRGWSLNIESTGKVSFQIAKDARTLYLVDSAGDLPLNRWVNLTGVYIPGVSTAVYIDGKLDAIRTDNTPAAQYNSGLSVAIGARPNKETYFKGMVDEICIYNRALTAEEIGVLAK